MVDLSFSKKSEAFVLVSEKLKYHILVQGIFKVTSSIYYAVTIEESGRKSLLIQFHISLYNED